MIESIKDLQALFKLCRKQGVTEFKFNGVEFKFGDLPQESNLLSQNQESDPNEPTEEEIMYWSSPQGQQDLDKKVGLVK